MGTNCGLQDPDDVARLNHIANDLGVDSIEIGATLGVLMEAGQGAFGDPVSGRCAARHPRGHREGKNPWPKHRKGWASTITSPESR